jgi:hypothetical protein
MCRVRRSSPVYRCVLGLFGGHSVGGTERGETAVSGRAKGGATRRASSLRQCDTSHVGLERSCRSVVFVLVLQGVCNRFAVRTAA